MGAFEIEAFFSLTDAERRVIEDRHGPPEKITFCLNQARHLRYSSLSHVLGKGYAIRPLEPYRTDLRND
jgi:hypothetical protein